MCLGPVCVYGHGTKVKRQEEWGKVLLVFCTSTFCSLTQLSSVRAGKALTSSLVLGGWSLGQQQLGQQDQGGCGRAQLRVRG